MKHKLKSNINKQKIKHKIWTLGPNGPNLKSIVFNQSHDKH